VGAVQYKIPDSIQTGIPSGIPVVVLMGQSNAVGVGPIASVPAKYQGTIANAKIWNGSAWVNLTAGSTNQAADGSTLGPEMSLMDSLVTFYGTPVYLIKHAITSTDLNTQWRAGSGPLFFSLADKIKAAMAALPSAGYIKAYYWMQGENDAADTTMASAYQTNLTNLVAAVRGSFYRFSDTQAPFVVGRLAAITTGSYPFRDTVIAAQNAVAAADTKVLIVNNTDATLNGDNIHLNGPSQITLGNRFATASTTNTQSVG